MSDAHVPALPWYRHRLVWVLTCFVTTYLLIPLTEGRNLPIVTSVTLLAGIWLAATALAKLDGSRAIRLLTVLVKGICLLLLALAATRPWLSDPRTTAHSVFGLGGLLLYGLVSLLVAYGLLRHVMTSRRIGLDEIAGAICVYYLMAVVWGVLYTFCLAADPGAFKGLEPVTSGPVYEPLTMLYFSFVTLTTLGYGDISPHNAWTGTLATMEAFVGQLYLAVLVARLVGLYIADKPIESAED